MKNDIKTIVKEIKKEIKNNLVSIILFGSAARKTQEKESDYDILVITSKSLKNDWKIGGKIKYNLFGKLERPVDIIFQDESDLKYPSPLWYEIYSASRVLYGKDIIFDL